MLIAISGRRLLHLDVVGFTNRIGLRKLRWCYISATATPHFVSWDFRLELLVIEKKREKFQEDHVDTRHVSDLMAGQVLVLSLRLEFLVCVPARIFVPVHARCLCVCVCGIESQCK